MWLPPVILAANRRFETLYLGILEIEGQNPRRIDVGQGSPGPQVVKSAFCNDLGFVDLRDNDMRLAVHEASRGSDLDRVYRGGMLKEGKRLAVGSDSAKLVDPNVAICILRSVDREDVCDSLGTVSWWLFHVYWGGNVLAFAPRTTSHGIGGRWRHLRFQVIAAGNKTALWIRSELSFRGGGSEALSSV